MQWLAEICVRRPIFAAMLILALVVAGAAAYWQLATDRFPRMDFPTVMVRTILPGAAPEEVESEITQILEDAVASVDGIDELRSISSDGVSLLLLTFTLNRDIDAAAQDVRDAVNTVLNRLPRNADPPVIRKTDTDSSPVLTLSVAGARDSRELYVLADRYVKNVIESAPGVGGVSIAGAMDRAVQIEVDARRLKAYNLSITQVHQALVRQNAEIPGGRVDAGHRELSLRTLGRLPRPRDFPDLVIGTQHETPIRIRDLGRVVDGQKEARTLARLDGQPAVVLQIQRQSGANTLDVIAGVKERLVRAQALLPEDVTVEVIQDQSRYIKAAMHEIRQHLLWGSVFASLVVLLFMRSWRSTVIASVAIPASIIATFAMMRVFDFTLNNITMLALVLMVGVVIDDAIVVLENVFRCIEENGMDPTRAAIQGTKEIGLAVLATTLSLVIVFLPVSFLSSLAGKFLFQFGITASVAILVSLLVSFSLTPMMCSRMLRVKREGNRDAEPASRRGFYHVLEVGYAVCLRWSMRHRWVVAVASLLVVAANVPLYFLVSQDYVPTNVDESEFELSVQAPEGASLAAMDRAMQAVEAELREVRGVVHLLTTVGSTGLGRVNQATVYVRLADSETRTFSVTRFLSETIKGRPRAAFEGNFSQRQAMLDARKRLAKFTDLRVSVRNLTSLRQGAPVDIDYVLMGPDLGPLAKASEELRQRAENTPGIVDVDTTLRLDKPELHVEIDRERAAALGVDAQEVAESLRIMVGGDDRVSRYRDLALDDVYDVELRLVGDDRGSKAAISQLYVRSKFTGTNGVPRMVRLDNIVKFRDELSVARIDRLDRQRMVALRCNVAPGYALADRIAALREATDKIGLPPGYTARVLGRGRELERTFRDFAFAFGLSMVFMYLILAAQFEHLVHPLTILVSLPLSVPFGLLSLWLGGETLNLYSALGILVLFGVVKKNSILQVDHTNQLRASGMDRLAAILQANRDRLRPILMTTLAFVAGMLPLVVGTGPGAEERRSIAVLVLGGQTLSLLLTLLATPVVYSLFDDLAASFVSSRRDVPALVAVPSANGEEMRNGAVHTPAEKAAT